MWKRRVKGLEFDDPSSQILIDRPPERLDRDPTHQVVSASPDDSPVVDSNDVVRQTVEAVNFLAGERLNTCLPNGREVEGVHGIASAGHGVRYLARIRCSASQGSA